MNKTRIEKKRFFSNLFLAFVIASLMLFLSHSGLIRRVQLAGLDVLFELRGPLPAARDIVIIEIDDHNIHRVGRWPWSRDWHAAMTRALNHFGAELIYFDIIFSEPADEGSDDIFASAIQEAGNVYLPFVFRSYSRELEDAFFPLDKFMPHIKGTGAINVSPDLDGKIRRLPLYFEAECTDKRLPHIALELAMARLGYDRWEKWRGGIMMEGEAGRGYVPLMDGKNFLVNWKGLWGDTFSHYSFIEVLNAYSRELSGEEAALDLRDIRQSLCMVAVTAIGLYDIQSVPLQAEYPGVGVLATAASNIIAGNFVRPVPFWVNWLIIYLLSLVPFMFISGERPFRELSYLALFALLFMLGVMLVFRHNWWIEPVAPVFSFFVSYWSVAVFHFIRAVIEKQRYFRMAITDELTGVANIRYFTTLLETECLMARRDDSRRFSIIMGDIDHFKPINDTYGHKTGDEVLKAVAGILQRNVRASDVVARYGGEEWIMLLRDTGLEDACRVAEKIRKSLESTPIENPYARRAKHAVLHVTLSLGVSFFREEDDKDSVVQRADEALYVAKNSGRNRVEREDA